MIFNFRYEMLPTRIIFGSGARNQVKREVDALQWTKVVILSSPSMHQEADRLANRLGTQCIAVYEYAVQHVPLEIVQDVLDKLKTLKPDALIALGGGSVIGIAKAVALETALPIMAIPTTYSGSEMTPIWGITDSGVKKTGRNPVVKPQVVIYDPELTLSLPHSISITSGINAMAHCVEAMYSSSANPLTSLMAEEGIRAMVEGLTRIKKEPHDLQGRNKALYGSWLGGAVLGSVGMALHHKLCHVLGGSLHLPHAETHTVVFPYVLAYNAPYVPQTVEALKRIFQNDDPNIAGTLYDFLRSLNAPRSLAELGMEEKELRKAVALAVQSPYDNPRPVSAEGVQRILQMAYKGERPEKSDL